MNTLSTLREQIRLNTHADETECVKELIDSNALNAKSREKIVIHASNLVQKSREKSQDKDLLDDFLAQFGLSNREGIALMCLAEALLRIPDATTADELIAEKISSGDWRDHLGQSNSLFVNASTWGLMLTGKIVHTDDLRDGKAWLENMINRLGEPIVRKAMLQAMKILGSHYVLGRDIREAMRRGSKENAKGTRFSFDMLGEGARTRTDAQKYFDQYKNAIIAIGEAKTHEDVNQADGISIKISALHPRYEPTQQQRVYQELLPQILTLAKLAKSYNIGFTIDAEEARRLDISLDIFEKLANNEALAGWNGLGFVLQAYQKRALPLARWLIALAESTNRRLMVRLVKGAYWDSEIKFAQEHGYADYPVFTRKANTDLSYQACSQILLNAQTWIYPQFATHNAHTIALITELAQQKDFEFQRLHGMGKLLYNQQTLDTHVPLRIYAPVGAHKDLLPYLVRRLLENGANSSFVNRFLDKDTPIEKLIIDTLEKVQSVENYRHPAIALPKDIFQQSDIPRDNSRGYDIDDPHVSQQLVKGLQNFEGHEYFGGSVIGGEKITGDAPVKNPSNNESVGYVSLATKEQIDKAITLASSSQYDWNASGPAHRASLLDKLALSIEQHNDELLALIVFEAGRTIKDGLNEIREAVEFCRYYAQLARQTLAQPIELCGPTGESNLLSLEGRGVFVCISPWNFPLAIFVGQVTAALVAGNTVIAKPAEQTPLVASKVCELMLEVGFPPGVLQLIVGDGQVGARLVEDACVAGVAFTGSTSTAKHIQRSLAQSPGPIVPLIAETGGQNAMIVDSSALLEQVTDDVISSAFLSAGQRCSSLRVLFVQSDIADELIRVISEACDQLHIGQPQQLQVDIGPVIDQTAKDVLEAHIDKMKAEATTIYRYPDDKIPTTGFFVGPHIFELSDLSQLEHEVFGPILHVIRWKTDQLDSVIESINKTQFGLTLGIHTRIEQRAKAIFSKVRVGNTYVNRNMIGAVVGVNPFGGQALSGTGPKAGGPHYLRQFTTERTLTRNTVATGGNAELLSIASE